MPYVVPSPATSPSSMNSALPSPSAASTLTMSPPRVPPRIGSSDSLPTCSSEASSQSSESDDGRSPPSSSPPTPETGLPSLGGSPSESLELKNPQLLNTFAAYGRPLRNHIRSHSHDAVSGLSSSASFVNAIAAKRSRLGNALGTSPSSSFIYLHPASPDEKEEVVDDGMTHSASTDSILSIGSPPTNTIWPEGDKLEESPAVLAVSLPEASTSSHATTPRAMPRKNQNLRINVQATESQSSVSTPMIRKKSGEWLRSSLKKGTSTAGTSPVTHTFDDATPRVEPVTTPGLSMTGTRQNRAKSAPSTPTGPKNVHFSSNLEEVKLFLSQQRPLAVSRQGSPQETTEEESEAYPFPNMISSSERLVLLLPNFPLNPQLGSKEVALQSLELLQDTKMLRGIILVKNLAFNKRVVVRFTLDNWQTISETTAEYSQSLEDGACDQFVFRIKLQDMLARIDEKKMLMAIKYSVNNTEYWDNNGGQNYLCQFKREQLTKTRVSADRKPSNYTWAVNTAGQAAERMADLRKMLDKLAVDEADDYDNVERPRRVTANSGRGFSNRYDFGAALKQPISRNASTNAPFFHPMSSAIVSSSPQRGTRDLLPSQQPLSRENGASYMDFGTSYPGASRPWLPAFNPASYSPPYGDQTRSERFNSFPPTVQPAASSRSPRSQPLGAPPTPRMYDDDWATRGAFAHVVDSVPTSPRSLSPTRDPERGRHLLKGTRVQSPPPHRDTSPISPLSSSDVSMYSTPRSNSPEAEPNYVAAQAESTHVPTYSNFIEKYCFFQPSSGHGSALGLMPSPEPFHRSEASAPRTCIPWPSSNSSSEANTPSVSGSPLGTARPFERPSQLIA